MSCALFLSMVLVYAIPSESSDPCNDYKIIEKGKYRGTQCEYKSGKVISDRYMDDSLWYKAEGLNGSLSMPTNPVDLYQCSTIYPIWMNGSHPTIGMTVNRTMCVSGVTNCQTDYKIQVKNCSEGFYVYQLKQPPGFDMAYCFGENEPCPPTDPCVDIDREELEDDGNRALTCTQMDLCDDSVDGWYRINKAGSDDTWLKMNDKCPLPGFCGATSPIWLEEQHPNPSDGIVTRNACVRNSTDCCGERFQIRVVNCQSFYVYELKARETCPERYCFGNIDNDFACINNNNTFDGNNGCRLQTNIIQEVFTALLVSWMCSRGRQW